MMMNRKSVSIEAMVRKTFIFAALFSIIFGVFVGISFWAQQYFGHEESRARFAGIVLSVLLIVFAYGPIRRFLVNLTDRFLFQKKYGYQKLLRDASAGISQIKSLRHLANLVVHFMTMRVRVKTAVMMVKDERTERFRAVSMRGFQVNHNAKPCHVLAADDILIDYANSKHAPVSVGEINKRISGWKQVKDKNLVAEQIDKHLAIKNRMNELEAACFIPSFLGRELKSILFLGNKKSGDDFSDDDLNVLFTLAEESAIAIENARLYDEAVQKAEELEAINRQLQEAQSRLIKALDETEIANKQLRDTQVHLIHEQKMATLGRLASSVGHEVNNPLTILSMNVSRAILKYRRDPDLKVGDILDVFQKMEQNISRIKAVVNTLTGLLKRSQHGKYEPLSLKLILEETLPLVQFQTYLENLSGTEVEFNIPGNIPLIKGDLERLQEVFLNLFINAYHAMAGRKDRKITVTAHPDPNDSNFIVIEFSDNGCGMTDEVMKKAFSYGFTTKPSGKGSGIGLYMCRYIVELHGGEIRVRAKVNEGTTFVITLPIYREEPSSTSAQSSTT
ncbi:MAG: hypothetical protein A3G33_02310 [Omnitrophica bacterium RIFCSPLOWO2_12_FULL_44_17]|uniref:histidine kinase n=1 Tax=Candidatus Danuiimicrobium aquiferis TaxID=1801832 RepID=A0A1G1L148_9BACT|nr:MAG: hypothetical protein A3B72_01890 [Omnitrophica bacterium RIFCSPHIGHO2_02_FULL_45_28]OGW90341.1 MAG: hypothetical protein A3E74_01360 [Omnitrophica bacterium RIFCSPHIGHO2_12_FULL_44_12]OGW98873.1 MAG: hypothetical protein A3G33_02310 [Omnitrophica bacterium RIFCSPLOWO2_12_FULL_44_17]OGX02001.1 MAG: hypothetical protein A3J12_11305 [Omnitrophica bacterium RIFCSPLOWO2_02_FULL_44_11]